MTMRFLLILLASFFACVNAYAAQGNEHWVVYYTNVLPVEKFKSFDLIVFDSDSHPPLAPLKAQHKTLLGYISLGEAESYRSYYNEIKAKQLLLEANPEWKGHRVIDVRKQEWVAYVTDTLIPSILAQGFDGIMIDTIDSVTDVDDTKYKGMQLAAVQMIKTIRARYPTIKIMLNRGFSILPQVAGDIDMLMAESIYTDWQPSSKTPVILPKETYQTYVEQLRKAQTLSPNLKIYTLDYWKPSDKKGVKHIYVVQREHGFIPYVSTLSLQTIYPEPR